MAIATVPVTFEAVPVVFWLSVGKVQFVRVPDEGVQRAPPFTTKAHAVHTFTARAVQTPVQGVIHAHVVRSASYACTVVHIADATSAVPVTHEAGRPVAFVSVADEGVQRAHQLSNTAVPLLCNTQDPFGTIFTFIFVLPHVAVSVVLPVHPAICM